MQNFVGFLLMLLGGFFSILFAYAFTTMFPGPVPVADAPIEAWELGCALIGSVMAVVAGSTLIR